MSGGTKHQKTPRAMIHKRIIDAAAARPDAALAEIAADVPGSSTDLVERVLDEYGDPADDDPQDANSAPALDTSQDSSAATPVTSPGEPQTDQPLTAASTDDAATTNTDTTDSDTTNGETGTVESGAARHIEETEIDVDDSGESSTSEDEPAVDLEALSEKRYETLRAINAYPEASQRNLAKKLGVTAATISQRVNAIEGFDWMTRAEFVAGLFEETRAEFDAAFGINQPAAEPEVVTPDSDGGTQAEERIVAAPNAVETVSDGGRIEREQQVAALEARVASLESALEARTEESTVMDPELLSKVLHACIDAETISTEEEHRIIEQFLG